MIGFRVVSIFVVGIITATVLASGPFVPVDFTRNATPCEAGVPAGDGSATIEPSAVPESVTLAQSQFGAEVWQLDVPDTTVHVTDVQGCVRLNYELRIDALNTTTLSTITVSEDATEQLSLPKTTLHPDRVDEDAYGGELRVVYRGEENGTVVEQTVVNRNVTVEVAE